MFHAETDARKNVLISKRSSICVGPLMDEMAWTALYLSICTTNATACMLRPTTCTLTSSTRSVCSLLHALPLHSCDPRSCSLALMLSRPIPCRLLRRTGGGHLLMRQRVPSLTLAALCLLNHLFNCAQMFTPWAPPALSAMLEDLRTAHCCCASSSVR